MSETGHRFTTYWSHLSLTELRHLHAKSAENQLKTSANFWLLWLKKLKIQDARPKVLKLTIHTFSAFFKNILFWNNMLLYAIDAKESISKGIIEFWALVFCENAHFG